MNANANRVIAFENVTQASIFENEIKGQLSDGYWENARPYDHWQTPCEAEVIVDTENPGMRDVLVRRHYNFADKELVGYVGHRMIDYAKAAIALNDELMNNELPLRSISAFADYYNVMLELYENNIKEMNSTQKMVARWIQHYKIKHKYITKFKNIIDSVEYTEKDLMKDLRAMKKIVKKNY